jgi:hypothetical protein
MGKFVFAVLTGTFCWVGLAPAQDPTARALIDKAIQAQGGYDILSRAVAGYHKIKGVFPSDKPDERLKFTGESWGDASNRAKYILRGDDDNPGVRIMVVEETKGWRSYEGVVLDFDEKFQARMRKASYADKVASLVALVRDKGYTLIPLGESKVKGTTVLGVKVQYAGMPDIQLFFDKASGLLIKTAYRLNDLDTNKEFLQEVYYGNFVQFDPAAEPLAVLQAAKRDADGPALLRLLQDRIPTKDERERIDLLILELGRASFSVREKASGALKTFGPKAAGQLRGAVKSDDKEIARRATVLLDQLSQGDEPGLARAVVRLLAVRKPAGAAAALLAYLPWACDETTAREAQAALVSVIDGDAKARAAVEEALKDDDPQRRTVAGGVLGQDGGAFLKQPWRRVVLQGLRLPLTVQVYRDGKLYLDMEAFGHEYFNRFDDALFARPPRS